MDHHNCATDDDDVLRDLCQYAPVLVESLPGASADLVAVGGLPANPPVAERLERISTILKTGIRSEEIHHHRKERAMRGAVPTEGGSQEGLVQPPEHPVTPAAASLESLLAGPPPLLQRVHPRLGVTSLSFRVLVLRHNSS